MRNEGKSICNCCGRVLEQEEYINIEKQWGYFSDRDGTIQRGKICEECFERIAKTFKIPLEEELLTELLEKRRNYVRCLFVRNRRNDATSLPPFNGTDDKI